MAMQRALARLSSLMVLANRDQIPSFTSTITANPSTARERPWKDLISPSDLTEIQPDDFSGRRVVFFGEQHQQPQVLKAQLKILELLHHSVSQKTDRTKIVLVMEHFNFLQTPLLERFARQEISEHQLVQEYQTSNEGFQIEHYLPLLLLARELHVEVFGGFPPREWAGVVNKQGIQELRTHPQYGPLIPESFNNEGRWDQVSRIEKNQVMYLRSLLSGQPPREPEGKDNQATFESGILPAQTLKDTFLAFEIDRHLKHDRGTLVLVICGLGHSEYGYNASSRLLNCTGEQIGLVASKEWAAAEWIGDDPTLQGNRISHMVIPYHEMR